MNKRLLLLTGICSTAFSLVTHAQYPVIPHDLEAKGDSAMRVVKELSDKAWEKALPVVEKDAQNGKPYVPPPNTKANPIKIPTTTAYPTPGKRPMA